MSIRATTLTIAALVVVLSGCGAKSFDGPTADVVPKAGQCRNLSAKDMRLAVNNSAAIPCTEAHTAETYAVGQLPAEFEDVEYDDPQLAAHGYQACATGLMSFLGADESQVMRTVVGWAFFRPSKGAWDNGSRTYRCDVVGGGPQSKEVVKLPATARDLLAKPDDAWLACVDGPSVEGKVKVPCTQPHTWRAVTTIKLGEEEDPYPGDEIVVERTRNFCSDSVVAWLNYPVTYEFGYTWFREAEWESGNRRSVCWAKTEQ